MAKLYVFNPPNVASATLRGIYAHADGGAILMPWSGDSNPGAGGWETSLGSGSNGYNFSNFDAKINLQLSQGAQKIVVILEPISFGGSNRFTPSYVFTSGWATHLGVTRLYTCAGNNYLGSGAIAPGHSAQGVDNTAFPAAWMPAFKTAWISAVQAALTHMATASYASKIAYVRVGGGAGGEWWPFATQPTSAGLLTVPGGPATIADLQTTWSGYYSDVQAGALAAGSGFQFVFSLNGGQATWALPYSFANAEAAISNGNSIGMGCQGLQNANIAQFATHGTADGGSNLSGFPDANHAYLFHLYASSPIKEFQTLKASDPSYVGIPPSGTMGSLVPLLPYAIDRGATSLELYYQDWRVAYDPTYSLYPTYGAAYRAALAGTSIGPSASSRGVATARATATQRMSGASRGIATATATAAQASGGASQGITQATATPSLPGGGGGGGGVGLSAAFPRIVYDPGTGPEVLNFVYPPIQKPYLDDLEALRHDSMTSGGQRQSVLERIDTIKILQMENVPWPTFAPSPAGLVEAVEFGTVEWFTPLDATFENGLLAGDYVFVVAEDNGDLFGGAGTPTITGGGLSWNTLYADSSCGMWYAVASVDVPGPFTVNVDFGGVRYNRGINAAHYTGIPSVAVATSSLSTASPSVTINGIPFTLDNPDADPSLMSVFLVPGDAADLAHATIAIALQLGVPNSVFGTPPSPWIPVRYPNSGRWAILEQNGGNVLQAAVAPIPRIIYDAGAGPVTLDFTYPDTHKPYADLLEATRHDSISSSGIRTSMLERIDILKDLQVENVPWADLAAWKDFLTFALAGGEFKFYPDSTNASIFQTWELEDVKFSPKFNVRGISGFTLKMRRVPDGEAFAFYEDANPDPSYGDTFNWQRFMFYALQGGTFQYYPDRTQSAFQTWQLVDTKWTPTFNCRGLSKFTINMRLVPGGASST